MSKTFSKLTRPIMRKLSKGSVINEYGITFKRQQNNDGLFTVNIMVDGQRIHRVIGRESDGTTRTQAEEFVEKAPWPRHSVTPRGCQCGPGARGYQ